jgi:hypothetical protein
MPTYDFRSLSWLDFEDLTHSILEADLHIRLERFKPTADQGMDMRHWTADNGKVIAQAKHYVGSGYSKLLRALRLEEFHKVQRLQPARYVVVTSVPLSAADKDEIKAEMEPFILSTGDIYGAHDVNSALTRHAQVERANYKLWISSTEVLQQVLHAAEAWQSTATMNSIQRKLPLFVQNQVFPRALELLGERRTLIITGSPGIGKTTMAELLLYDYVSKGYEPVVIEGEISEAKKMPRRDRPQVFYFDDFLGQTFLGDRTDYLGRNQTRPF